MLRTAKFLGESAAAAITLLQAIHDAHGTTKPEQAAIRRALHAMLDEQAPEVAIAS